MPIRWVGKSEDGNTVTLRKISESFARPAYATEGWKRANSDLIRVAVAIDVETTGLDKNRDKVIEIGLRRFSFNRSTGEILEADGTFSALQDPGEPLSSEIKMLTGLDDATLSGTAIDWNAVEAFIADAHVLIAHNASFDRPFIDKHSKASNSKIWGCSLRHIDWASKGYPIQKLEVLGYYHGFFSESHRALNDVTALVWLIGKTDEISGATYLRELLSNAKRPVARVIANRSPFESKDLLKARKYNWDNQNRVWHKTIYKDELDQEVKWLESFVYLGSFGGMVQDISATDTFKDFS
ncbi:MAG: 3'-5' exonuclease [Candidatus Pacebacteria bacterium]|nr:3'-5' exonuclease [Candidatus Paceibacterota bacterium]